MNRDYQQVPAPARNGLFSLKDIEVCVDWRMPDWCIGSARPDGFVVLFDISNAVELIEADPSAKARMVGVLAPRGF